MLTFALAPRSETTLKDVYGESVIASRLADIRSKSDVSLLFNVDSTKISNEGVLPKLKQLPTKLFWNFPCTAEKGGQDGQNDQMDDNKIMLQR